MSPQERVECDRELAGLRASLAEPVFAALWSEGRAMNLEAAVELALENTTS